MKLYELTAQHKELALLADSDNGELAECLSDTFEALEGEFNNKAISLISVTRNMESDCEAIDVEIKRLQERKKIINNNQQRMRDYLRVNMEASGISKIECPLFSITLGKGRDMVDIINESDIPADYLNVKTTFSPMKADILKALKDGKEVKGCAITKSKSVLRIK